MKYLNPSGFTEPVSHGRMTELQYAIAVGLAKERRVEQTDGGPKRRSTDKKMA